MSVLDMQVMVLRKALQRLKEQPPCHIYLCHEICRAYAEDVPYSPLNWSPDEREVLLPLRSAILVTIAPYTTVEAYLCGNELESGFAAAREFRAALLITLLAELGVEA